MGPSNFEILGIGEDATPAQIREAFRRLALEHHSDRGGQDERFKVIKQAYEDLKHGKKYAARDAPPSTGIRPGETEADAKRRNAQLARLTAEQMEAAAEWISALERGGSAGTRVFGVKEAGQLEVERTKEGAVVLKGRYMAGAISCSGPVHMRGPVTSPSWTEPSTIRAGGDFRMANPVANRYTIDNGARIISETGDIVAGNVSGRKLRVPDPDGRVGVWTVRELRTELSAPAGKVIVENAVGTVYLNADTVILLNAEDDVRVRGRHILVYGGRVTYDVEFCLAEGGTIRFFEESSVQGISDDAVIRLANGKSVRLYDIKTKKASDVDRGAAPGRTMVGGGFVVTYEMLDCLGGGKRGLFGMFKK